MNALTKLFVVLLVVCSLLLSASMVVFVNKQENLQVENNTLHVSLLAAQSSKSELSRENGILQGTILSNETRYNNALSQRDSSIDALKMQLQAKETELASAKLETNKVQTQVTNMTNAVSAAQQENSKLQTDLSAVQGVNTVNVVKLRDLNIAVTKLTAENDTLDKQRKYLEEQVAQLKKQFSQAQAVMIKANIKYDAESGSAELNGQPIVGVPGPLVGHISDIRTSGGIHYATISIGSSENVTKGMKFYVVDDHGEFFGILIVDNVQSNEAIGSLDGPKVDQIKTGLSVKTQL